ncbi:MAG: GntR family transcriptional regulator [Peptostreptococcaceae bacterium]|nr:GntR family transcriptional regulator [Peptostreptococcaceae bacterium]
MIIDLKSEIPIYEQIVRQVILEIDRGELKAGEMLPSVRQLAQEIGINLHTVNKSYQILKAKGYVEIDRRRGVYIREDFSKMDEVVLKEREAELRYWIADFKNRGMSMEEIRLFLIGSCADPF